MIVLPRQSRAVARVQALQLKRLPDEATLNINILRVAQPPQHEKTQRTMNRLGLCVGVVCCCPAGVIKRSVSVRHSPFIFFPPPSLWVSDIKHFLSLVSSHVRVRPRQNIDALQLSTTSGALLTCHSKLHIAFTNGRGSLRTLHFCAKICASTLKGLQKRRPPCLAPTRLFFSELHFLLTWMTLAMGNTFLLLYPSARVWAVAKEVMCADRDYAACR